MAKSKQPPEATGSNDQELAESVYHLADEVEVLRNAIDEFREIFTWAVRSDRIRGGTDAPTAVEPPPALVLELDEDQFQAMTEALKESVQDLANDVEGAVRDDLKEQFADFRDSVDQFSIDVQFAARKIHEKPAAELSDLRETLQGEIVDLRGSVEQFMMEVHDALRQIRSEVQEPAAAHIAQSAAPTPNQPEHELATGHQEPARQTNTDTNDLQWLARKSFTASSAVAHIAESDRARISTGPNPARSVALPSPVEKQRSFLDLP